VPIVDTIATTTNIFEVIICASKWFPPYVCGSDIWISIRDVIFPVVAALSRSFTAAISALFWCRRNDFRVHNPRNGQENQLAIDNVRSGSLRVILHRRAISVANKA
jgi:hypothetical protein